MAEEYATDDPSIEAGDVVCLGQIASEASGLFANSNSADTASATPDLIRGKQSTSGLVKCSPNGKSPLGVVSTKPAIILGDWGEQAKPPNVKPVALAGRVPVKVTDENGPIQAGDYISLSTTQKGYAQKMSQSGMALGMALESFGSGEGHTGAKGSILVFVNLTYQKISLSEDDQGNLINDDEKVYEFGGLALVDVKAIASISGKWSIDESGLLVAVKVKAEVVEVTKGVTIFDRTTGSPYCVFVDGGIIKTEAGACDAIQEAATSSGTAAGEATDTSSNSELNSESAPGGTEVQPLSTPETDSASSPQASSGLQEEPAGTEEPVSESVAEPVPEPESL